LSRTQQPLKIQKIAMLGTFPPLRGLSSYCLEVASAIGRRINVEFISFKKIYPGFLYPGGDLKEDHTFPAAKSKGLRIRRRLTWYNPLTWFAEAVLPQAELLHAQWWSLPLAVIYFCICGIFKLRGKPVVFTVHNVLSHDGSRLYKTASQLLFRLGDHFIVHTEKNRQQLITCYGIRSGKISVIPHGSLDFHVRNQIDPLKVREGLGIAPNQKVVLLFGAIRPYKGVNTAIEAFSKVVEDVPEAVLLIAGKLWQSWQPYQLMIERLAIDKVVKTYIDYVPSGDVHKYFEAADLVILPYEQFDSQSGVGSTAVSFRKPMIVSNVGGLPDLVSERRWVVPPKNPLALSRAIIDCLTDPALLARMTADSEKVAARLSWTGIAEQTIALYDTLISESGQIQMIGDQKEGN
jgi:glycosyltransferase involved in cell wall biosynthesis